MPVTTADQARAQREREVENALATVRMEGLEPSADAEEIFRRYVDGELSFEEMGRAVDQLLERQYGPYVYPGTNVLRNLRGIRDADQLNRFEAIATTRRSIELEHDPVRGSFDTRHLQAIHGYIFQDVFDWAGDFRTVNISKSGDPFAFSQHIASSLDRVSVELKLEGYLFGADCEHFATRGAYYLGEINAVHPFREGNGRTQREFIRELGARNGFVFDWRQVSQEEMIEASRLSLRMGNKRLERILRQVIGTPNA